MGELNCRPIIPGSGEGPLLTLSAPISFWGGVDPETAQICDPRHPDFGACITDTFLAIPATIGSSSSSAIMLELIRNRLAPAALLLGNVDAILVLGIIVARELGYQVPPAVEVDFDRLSGLANATILRLAIDGQLDWDDTA